ncbi:hypothetical protein N9N67_03445 [Bacteriovoracaceae bacterium]|nr:hypothetical protein [Bacteriovoracaceae bacterium]
MKLVMLFLIISSQYSYGGLCESGKFEIICKGKILPTYKNAATLSTFLELEIEVRSWNNQTWLGGPKGKHFPLCITSKNKIKNVPKEKKDDTKICDYLERQNYSNIRP